jgi:hypothetical protein
MAEHLENEGIMFLRIVCIYLRDYTAATPPSANSVNVKSPCLVSVNKIWNLLIIVLEIALRCKRIFNDVYVGN